MSISSKVLQYFCYTPKKRQKTVSALHTTSEYSNKLNESKINDEDDDTDELISN